MKARFFSAVLSAILLAAASVGVTAYAEEKTASSAADTVEATTEHSTTTANETDRSSETTVAPVTIPDFYGDPHYDTDGNATLIKSESIIYDTEEMQFIAVTTKDGHVFYVLINYSAENGQDNVYFLNRVDDYDLYALLYAGDDEKESKITPEQAAQAAEEANGRVKTETDSRSANTAETTKSVENTSEGDVKQAKSVPMNKNSIYLVFGVIALIGVGGAGFFLMKKKNSGNKTAVQVEPEYDDETEITEDDDYPDYLDENKEDEV